MSRNWAELGISWEIAEVCKRVGGDTDASKQVVGTCVVPIVVDLATFRAQFPDLSDTDFLGASSSITVKAQDVCRREGIITTDPAKLEALKEKVWARLQGVRSVGVRKPSTPKRPLPDNTFYTGTDEVEYRQLWISGQVDLGVPVEVAKLVAANIAF
jgi:hypothetical protein